MDADETFDVLIVGAGISGIGLAAHLAEKLPHKRFAILDRRERIGGTWDLFRYPGIRSDSDMYTLGYAFAPWREEKAIAEGDTILAYLDRVVAERGLGPHIRLGRTVTAADWDSKAARWTVTLADGERLTTRFLFLGSGYYDYDEPHDAAIPGLADFAGTTIHPQFWPPHFDHSGKRVVVIGSGATAVTLVPALAEKAEQVIMLQRTPSWYMTLPSRDPIARQLRRLLPERLAYAAIRWKNVRLQDYLFKRSRNKPEKMKEFLTAPLRRRLGERFREEDFTPPYGPWEQRMCLVPDGDFFKAMKRGKAQIVTGRIARVERDGIRLEDGRHIAADVIVTATGLRLAVAGKIAVSLDGSPVRFGDHFYYRDCMFSNLPNLAAVFGYLNAGWTLRVDIVAEWLCRLLARMDALGADVATPVLPADHDLVDARVWDLFSSGYLQRGRALIPKSATTAPWQISMDYLSDRKALRRAPIEDGVMRLQRVRDEALA